MDKSKNKISKKDLTVFKITIIILILLIGVLAFLLFNTRQEQDRIVQEKVERIKYSMELENELETLMKEYEIFKNQHDSILHDKDEEIQEKAREIERLIAQQADYNRIKRRLSYLQDIYKDYVTRIDSLYKVAEVLRIERDEALEEVSEIRSYATGLEDDKQQLTSKVEVASALRAYEINAGGFRTRFTGTKVEEDRARRVEYIEVCFNIAENRVAPPGERNVYLRIADPNENILRISDDDQYSFIHNKDTLQFTKRQNIDYRNQEIDVCMIWDRTSEYNEGLYLVSIFTDEHRIGETAFTLR